MFLVPFIINAKYIRKQWIMQKKFKQRKNKNATKWHTLEEALIKL